MTALPTAFVESMRGLVPDFSQFLSALAEPAPASVRLNPAKTRLEGPAQLPWCPAGHTLDRRPLFAFDPRWHAGAYYVQDASCMVLEAVLNQLQLSPRLMLDACAAPGGKSTHLAAIYPDALLLANEVIKSRSAILNENLARWGSRHVANTRLDPEAFGALPDCFDLMLADVPCSGEGLFRKDPAARAEWSPAGVELCVRRQRRILADLWPSLKPGGLLIYSTCTFNLQENEAQLSWLQTEFAAEPVAFDLPSAWPIEQQGSSLRCYPHRVEGEGFFLGLVRKPARPEAPTRIRDKLDTLSKRDLQRVPAWLNGENWCFGQRGETLLAWPQPHHHSLQMLQRLPTLRFGIPLGEIKGKSGQELRPVPELALSQALDRTAFRELPLTFSQALAYLRGEALYDLPAARGLSLASFEGWPLGWLKSLDTRANNLYPQGWRIRRQPSPAEAAQAWTDLQMLLPLTAR